MSCNRVSSSHTLLPRALTLLPYLLSGGSKSTEVSSPGKGADLVYLKVAWKSKEKKRVQSVTQWLCFLPVSSPGNCVSLRIRAEHEM